MTRTPSPLCRRDGPTNRNSWVLIVAPAAGRLAGAELALTVKPARGHWVGLFLVVSSATQLPGVRSVWALLVPLLAWTLNTIEANPCRAFGSPPAACAAAKACWNVTPGSRRTSVGDPVASPLTVDTTLTAPAGTVLGTLIELPVIAMPNVGKVPAAVADVPPAASAAAAIANVPVIREMIRLKTPPQRAGCPGREPSVRAPHALFPRVAIVISVTLLTGPGRTGRPARGIGGADGPAADTGAGARAERPCRARRRRGAWCRQDDRAGGAA